MMETPQEKLDRQQQDILQEFLACNSACADLGTFDTHKDDFVTARVEKLVEQLPGIDYILSRELNYIFSNGLTTGSKEADTRLSKWLYETVNLTGQTNFSVLRDVIGNAIIFGECGLRWYEGNIYSVKRGLYGVLTETKAGITEPIVYFIRKDGNVIGKDIKLSEIQYYDDISNYFDTNGMIMLDSSEFVNVRNDTSEIHGQSPLLKDRQRLKLLLSTYEHLNYDIDYDGPGRIILRPKDGYLSGDAVSTSSIVDNSEGAQKRRNERAQEEIKRIGREIKNSSSDSAILLSNAFDKDITHLPRVTKAIEFMDWISNEGVILAQILGMSPTLLEVGDLHGNISVSAIIDNAMLNTIVPIREQYATQFSYFLGAKLGFEKVYFDKYDLQQAQDINDMREKAANTLKDLAMADKYSPSEIIKTAINELTEVIRTSLYDNEGEIQPLA